MILSGDYSKEVTPVPMPNTEVKLLSADGSRLTFRKSRTLPGKHIGCDEPRPKGLFFLPKKELNFQFEELQADKRKRLKLTK